MRIINVVQIHKGFIRKIDSFLVTEDQLSEDVIEMAQKCFIDSIEKRTGNKFSDDDAEEIILNGSYDDLIGYSIELVWSDSVNE